MKIVILSYERVYCNIAGGMCKTMQYVVGGKVSDFELS